MSERLRGYHFTGCTLRDGRPIPAIGQWLEYDGPVVPCESGLHMSEHPMDALKYAPGNTLHLVELEGDCQPHGDPIDKCAGRRRRILATVDAEPLLRKFARWCALRVIHLWDAPVLVRQYLETGDESLREAARQAAWEAAQEAAWEAAQEAAWEAARAAAVAAAWAATRDAAWAAARESAMEATQAARAAEWAAVWEAAMDAAWAAQRNEMQRLVDEAFEGGE
jgi:hypothetical protein